MKSYTRPLLKIPKKAVKGIQYLNEELQKIKKGESSFIGMDGGNPNSDYWFCGIEFGSQLEEMADYYDKYIEFNEVKELLIPYRKDCPKIFLKSFFDKYLASIYSNLFLNNELPNKEDIDSILKKDLYNKTSEIFKINLFPLAKKDVSWDKTFESKLKISKSEYYGEIFSNRIKFIKELSEKFKPKNIICFSTKEYSEYFERTFFNENEKIEFQFDSIKLKNGKKGNIKIYKNGVLNVIVIPFLGRGNLASYEEVRMMTNYLKEKYIE